jgi:hypothetical protein
MDAGIAAGRWWPRWVLETNWGLGGATFYTYPPLAYWSAALLRRLTGLSIADTLAWAMALWRLLFVFGCWLWLRRHVAPIVALAAAALAVLLPYAALINPWVRFAYAEVAGAALIPFVLIALERLVEDEDLRRLPALALAFGALALTRMPVTALVAHLAPLYAWAYSGRLRGALLAILGGAAGAGLVACFMLPAAALLPYLNFMAMQDGMWQHSLAFFSPLGSNPVWARFLLAIWGSAALAVLVGLYFRLATPMATPLRQAGTLLLLTAAALMTVMTLPLWQALPELRAVEFPWRAAGLLTVAVAALAALALAEGRRGPWWTALGFGVLSAALLAGFLVATTQLGNPDWPRFLPAEPRLARALSSARGVSSQHLPAIAVAAGWMALYYGTETEPGPDPHPRPVLPPGARRLPAGFLIPEASTSFALPQFFFPVWRAHDVAGRALPVRARPDGFLEVVVSRPTGGIEVTMVTTLWEWLGWAISGLTAAGLLALRLHSRLSRRVVARVVGWFDRRYRPLERHHPEERPAIQAGEEP